MAKRINLQVTPAEKGKAEWVARGKGKSVQAWLKAILLKALAREPDPPAGFWVGKERED